MGSILSSFPYPDEFLILVKPPMNYTEVDEAAERAIKTLLKFNPRVTSSHKLLKTSTDDSFTSSSPSRSPSATSQRSGGEQSNPSAKTTESSKNPKSPIDLSEDDSSDLPHHQPPEGESQSNLKQEDKVRVRSNSNSQTCSGAGAQHRSPPTSDKDGDAIHFPAVPRRCFLLVRISTRQVKLIYYNFCSEAR